MDLSYFMRERTALIRLFYTKCRLPFDEMQQEIEAEVPPWEPPPFNPDYDSPEPAFVEEFMQAEHARELVGLFAVSLLADTLKGYFEELQRDLCIEFKDDKARRAHFKAGPVEGYRQIIEHVMGEAYASCPVRFDLIEQVVLARNNFAHNTDFVIFQTAHNRKTLKKHPNPLFVSRLYEPAEEEEDEGLQPLSLRSGPKIEIDEDKLMTAIAEVEKLADWVQSNEQVMWEWQRQRWTKKSD
ncbi:hypothetical protein SAMN02745911_3792 [Aureimonas altamirensis DSM 21988]|uniref:DUF4145 domain-containing protein n=2 Tax=Aureimonas altamirensis TaxID=370622 RepID=A0ABY1IQU9_9HYPH|nr:hypothetical protein SAMN02745911_3792 [Aureimonas altamirensis DSM 21988]